MDRSNAEVVREAFERFASGQLDSALELFSEDFALVVPPSLSAEPDTYVGHQGVRRYFAGFDGQLDDVRYEPLDMIEDGDLVFVPMMLSGRGTTSGIEVAQEATAVFGLRDGLVVRIESHPDLESARRAASRW